MIGAVSTPASAPSSADNAKLRRRIDFTSMPISSAASRFCAVASIALPSRVRLKKQASAAITASRLPTTQNACGFTCAPPMSTGTSPENEASR